MSLATEVVSRLDKAKQTGQGQWLARCCYHPDKKPSLSVSEDAFHCFGCGQSGHITSIAKFLGIDVPNSGSLHLVPDAAYQQLHNEAGHTKETLDIYGVSYTKGEWHYPYEGTKATKVKKSDPKEFFWVGHDANNPPAVFGLDLAENYNTPIVFVVEGEKDVITMAEAGIASVCFPNGCASVPDHSVQTLSSSKFSEAVVVYDNDDGGEDGRWIVKDALEASGVTVKVLDLPPEFPPGSDITNVWNVHDRDPEAFRSALEGLTEAERPEDGWDEITRPLSPLPPSLPLDALAPVLGQQVESVAASIEVPSDIPALLSLVSLSACIGGKFELLINDSWLSEFSVLYGLAIAASGERKSDAFKYMTRPISDWERDKRDAVREKFEYAQEMVQVRIDQVKKARNCVVNGNSDNAEDELEDALKNLHTAKQKVLELDHTLLAEDITTESMNQCMQASNGRMALLSAEGGVLKILDGRYNDGKSCIEEVKKGWSGERIIVSRASGKAIDIPRAAITIGLCLQPDVLESLSNNKSMRNEGFLARCLYAQPQSLVGFRKVRNQEARDMAADSQYERALRRLLDVPWCEEDGRLTTWPMEFTEDAVDALLDYAEEVEPQMAGGRRLGGIADWANKAHGQVARIAGLQTLVTRACVEGPIVLTELFSPIEKQAVQDAVRLVRSFEDHALYVLARLGQDRATKDLTYVLHRRLSLPENTTKRDLFRACQRFASMAEFEPVVDALVDRNYFRLQYQPTGKKGREPSPKVLINPAVLHDTNDTDEDDALSVISVSPDEETELNRLFDEAHDYEQAEARALGKNPNEKWWTE